jgi:hypothetical protein
VAPFQKDIRVSEMIRRKESLNTDVEESLDEGKTKDMHNIIQSLKEENFKLKALIQKHHSDAVINKLLIKEINYWRHHYNRTENIKTATDLHGHGILNTGKIECMVSALESQYSSDENLNKDRSIEKSSSKPVRSEYKDSLTTQDERRERVIKFFLNF